MDADPSTYAAIGSTAYSRAAFQAGFQGLSIHQPTEPCNASVEMFCLTCGGALARAFTVPPIFDWPRVRILP